MNITKRTSMFKKTEGTGQFISIVEDDTDLKRTEKAIRENEERYRQLFQSAPIALIERDTSNLKAYLEQLRTSGISDLRAYLEKNPQQVHHCWGLIQTVDTHGHLNGSRVIQKVAGTIEKCIETPAYAVAYAGDEFVVVLPGIFKTLADSVLLKKAKNAARWSTPCWQPFQKGCRMKIADLNTVTVNEENKNYDHKTY